MKSAKELVRTHPGAFARRQEIILALCQRGVQPILHDYSPAQCGEFIVMIANRIIEETEQ